jgi:neutral trehalase
MDDQAAASLLKEAKEVLQLNDRELWTVPAGDLYPHQWLWDSCFIAIGLRHLDIERAKTELTSLLRGQWSNGMLPNIIFNQERKYWRDRSLWRSWISPYAPDDMATSGITQPPLLAEAVVRVGQKLKLPERRSWYKQMLPHLVDYHEWLYADRDPHKEGLIILLHPYESGLDSSPPWVSELRKHSMPLWLKLMEGARLAWIIGLFRRDTQHVTLAQRTGNIEATADWAAMLRLRRKAYNSEAILSRSLFAVEDLAFNSILIRANKCLADIAKLAGHDLAEGLLQNMAKTEIALEQLWDDSSGQYFSRSFVGHKLIEEPTIATLLPLYSGAISKEKAARLVELLKRRRVFSTSWPVPSVPINSSYFDPYKYWQGPTWVNTNWLIIDGLKRYGYAEEAKVLQDRTLQMVAKNGMYEYFNPLNGTGAGAANFSWTAALAIDLLKN